MSGSDDLVPASSLKWSIPFGHISNHFVTCFRTKRPLPSAIDFRTDPRLGKNLADRLDRREIKLVISAGPFPGIYDSFESLVERINSVLVPKTCCDIVIRYGTVDEIHKYLQFYNFTIPKISARVIEDRASGQKLEAGMEPTGSTLEKPANIPSAGHASDTEHSSQKDEVRFTKLENPSGEKSASSISTSTLQAEEVGSGVAPHDVSIKEYQSQGEVRATPPVRIVTSCDDLHLPNSVPCVAAKPEKRVNPKTLPNTYQFHIFHPFGKSFIMYEAVVPTSETIRCLAADHLGEQVLDPSKFGLEISNLYNESNFDEWRNKELKSNRPRPPGRCLDIHVRLIPSTTITASAAVNGRSTAYWTVNRFGQPGDIYKESDSEKASLPQPASVQDIVAHVHQALPHTMTTDQQNPEVQVSTTLASSETSYEEERWKHYNTGDKTASAALPPIEEGSFGRAVPVWQRDVVSQNPSRAQMLRRSASRNHDESARHSSYGFKLKDTLESAPQTPLEKVPAVHIAAPTVRPAPDALRSQMTGTVTDLKPKIFESQKLRVSGSTLKHAYLEGCIAASSNSPASTRLLNIIKDEDVSLDTPLGLKLLDLGKSLLRGGEYATTEVTKDTESVATDVTADSLDGRLNDFAGMLNAIAQAVGVNFTEDENEVESEAGPETPAHMLSSVDELDTPPSLQAEHAKSSATPLATRFPTSDPSPACRPTIPGTLADLVRSARQLDQLRVSDDVPQPLLTSTEGVARRVPTTSIRDYKQTNPLSGAASSSLQTPAPPRTLDFLPMYPYSQASSLGMGPPMSVYNLPYYPYISHHQAPPSIPPPFGGDTLGIPGPVGHYIPLQSPPYSQSADYIPWHSRPVISSAPDDRASAGVDTGSHQYDAIHNYYSHGATLLPSGRNSVRGGEAGGPIGSTPPWTAP